jgi:hypothetical protein
VAIGSSAAMAGTFMFFLAKDATVYGGMNWR